jgi:hypothetical protein
MIVGIAMQQPTGLAPSSHEVSGNEEDARKCEGRQPLPASAGNVYSQESAQGTPQMLAPMNGTMPPQQVYVSAAMPGIPPAGISGLENQFQSLGFKQEDSIGTDQLTNSGNNSETNNLEDHLEETENEGEESEEEPVKLFIGQVSRESSLGLRILGAKFRRS